MSGEIEILGRQDYEDRVQVGRGSHFERDLTLWLAQESDADPRICLGERVYVGRNCYLGAHAALTIGHDVAIGAYSYLITANHRFDDPLRPVREQGYSAAPVTLGNDVWLGCHVIVLPGVVIGDGAIVGAGAVVTRSIGAREIWAGNPARKLRDR